MRISIVLVSAFLALSASSALAGQFFTNEVAFVNAIQTNYYLEDFNGFTSGNPPLDGSTNSYSAPGGNGFGWKASATNGLYSNASAISVATTSDPLTITFTNNLVTAVGGIVANTDFFGVSPGTVTITTSDGSTNSIVFAAATQGFLGYTTTVPITSITLNAISPASFNFVQLDHFYTGVANTNTLPVIIKQLILLNGSNRLDAINLPVGNNVIVETSTNLQAWSTNSTVPVTNSTQTIFVPSSINPVLFYRLHL